MIKTDEEITEEEELAKIQKKIEYNRMRRLLVKQLLTKDAISRPGNIGAASPEHAEQI